MQKWYWFKCPSCNRTWGSQQPEPDREWCSCIDYSDTFPVQIPEDELEGVKMDIAELKNRFEYHAPDATKIIIHTSIREECFELANLLNALLPEGREKSLAITKLEEVMYWGNASIARSGEV